MSRKTFKPMPRRFVAFEQCEPRCLLSVVPGTDSIPALTYTLSAAQFSLSVGIDRKDLSQAIVDRGIVFDHFDHGAVTSGYPWETPATPLVIGSDTLNNQSGHGDFGSQWTSPASPNLDPMGVPRGSDLSPAIAPPAPSGNPSSNTTIPSNPASPAGQMPSGMNGGAPRGDASTASGPLPSSLTRPGRDPSSEAGLRTPWRDEALQPIGQVGASGKDQPQWLSASFSAAEQHRLDAVQFEPAASTDPLPIRTSLEPTRLMSQTFCEVAHASADSRPDSARARTEREQPTKLPAPAVNPQAPAEPASAALAPDAHDAALLQWTGQHAAAELAFVDATLAAVAAQEGLFDDIEASSVASEVCHRAAEFLNDHQQLLAGVLAVVALNASASEPLAAKNRDGRWRFHLPRLG